MQHVALSLCHFAPFPPAALARTELAPLALHAYPEAYAEFKASMLSLLSSPAEPATAAGRGGSSSGSAGGSAVAAAESAAAGREALAGMLFRTIREALGEGL